MAGYKREAQQGPEDDDRGEEDEYNAKRMRYEDGHCAGCNCNEHCHGCNCEAAEGQDDDEDEEEYGQAEYGQAGYDQSGYDHPGQDHPGQGQPEEYDEEELDENDEEEHDDEFDQNEECDPPCPKCAGPHFPEDCEKYITMTHDPCRRCGGFLRHLSYWCQEV
jgi:hypothetical protein